MICARASRLPAMIFRAMQRYGLIVADNGSDMYIRGTFRTRLDHHLLNPGFGAMTANDFEVVTRGWQPTGPNPPTNLRVVSEWPRLWSGASVCRLRSSSL